MNPRRFKRFQCATLLLAALVCSGNLFGQSPVSGRVVDADGQAVIGATVTVDGTNNTVVTGANGAFSVNAASGATVTVSFLGFESTTAVMSPGMSIVLTPDATAIEDVVVVGYGSRKKETLTGAVAVVSDKAFLDKGGLSSPLQALQGAVPGVIVTRSSSAPGDEGWDVSLRGRFSTSDVDPMVVIDGVGGYSIDDMNRMNPMDIESMSFLKDGAAAIYGSQAAAGAILITTKKARKGRAIVSYEGSATIKSPGLLPNLLTLDQYADVQLKALSNDGNTASTWIPYLQGMKAYKGSFIDLSTTTNPFAIFGDTADIVFDDSTDWFGAIFGNAVSTQHNLSVSGGSDAMTYRLSAGYLYEDSPLQYGKNEMNRYNMRLNTTFKLSKWLDMESVISYNRQEKVRPTRLGSMLSDGTTIPGLPLFTMDGKAYAWGTWYSPASLAMFGGETTTSTSAVSINEAFKAKITSWLDANVNLGYNTTNTNYDEVQAAIDWYNFTGTRKLATNPTQAQTYYTQRGDRTDFYSLAAYLNAHHTFADAHNVSATVGYQGEHKQYVQLGAKVLDTEPSLPVINGNGTVTLDAIRKWHEALGAAFGRLNYDYKEKYLVEFSARYDGSSHFLADNRWSFFWGGSAGWRLSEEAFLKDVRWLNELKLRASYGETGNQGGIGRYDGLLLYEAVYGSGALLGSSSTNYSKTNGSLVSKTRTWERIKNYNIGLDFSLFKTRLTGSLELFWKHNDNMFVGLSYPEIIGDAAPKVNSGKLRASGFEGQVQWRDKVGDWSYHLGGSFTFARNKLVNLGSDAVALPTEGFNGNRLNYPINSWFGLRYAGNIQNEDQRAAYENEYIADNELGITKGVIRVGDHMYEDVNKDGKLTDADYVYLGTDDPEIQYSFTLGGGWKGIEISAMFQGAANRTVFNGINNYTVPTRQVYGNTTDFSIGNTREVGSPTGGDYPAYTHNNNINNYNYRISTWSISNAAYLRLKNLTVSYTLPSKLLAKQNVISNVRIYFTGTDLWESSKLNEGWDPEARRARDGRPAYERYPFMRSYSFGANITF